MYESGFVGQFFRLWGRREGALGGPAAALLNNAQNPFDAWFGDVCGQAGVRFFLIEFKGDRAGFEKEVSESGKLHRVHLVMHLRTDQDCLAWSLAGHFASYPNASGLLSFEPYAHAATPPRGADGRAKYGEPNPFFSHELDDRRWTKDFDHFFDALNVKSQDRREQRPEFFAEGLGIDALLLESYVDCMYQHLESFDDKGEIVLVAYDPVKDKHEIFQTTPAEMIRLLRMHFVEVRERFEQELNRSFDKPGG